MKFEEALTAMRSGSKITHPNFEKDVYLQACRVSLKFNDIPLEDMPISIVKMKGDRQDDTMAGKANYIAKIKRQLKAILSEEDYKKYHNLYTEIEIGRIFNDDVFSYPQLNLFLVMSDDWEIIE